MNGLLFDLRHALRSWRRQPGFAAVVILTLALGIGANAAVFSIVRRVLLAPLPYPNPSELVVLHSELTEQGSRRPKSSGPEFLDYRERSRSFGEIGLIWYRPGALTDDADEPEEIDMGLVSASFLRVLGVEPALGRGIADEEDLPNGPHVIVLSHDLWQRRYGGSREIVGKRIEFDAVPHTVVGVMPEGFRMRLPPDASVPALLDAWVPWGGSYDELPRTWRVFTALGRLAPQVSVDEARQELHVIAAQLREEFASDYESSGFDVGVEPLARGVVAHVEPMLVSLSGAVGFVLLIVCANVANLFLVRATGTERQMAVRAALGADRWRLARTLIAESAIISLAGALVGLLLARAAVSAAALFEPAGLRLDAVVFDGIVIGFALVVCVVTSVLFAVVSSFHAFRRDGAASVGHGSRTAGDSRQTMRRLLVVAELALCLVLLIGAGLLVRSFALLSRVDPGFEPGGVLTVKLSLVDGQYPYRDPEKIARFYRDLITRLSSRSEIQVVGASTGLPMDGQSIRLAPYAYDTPEGVLAWESVTADYRTITPGWLEAMGVPLAAGRYFEWTDDTDHPNVVIIDERLAERVWRGKSPIGERLQVEIFLDAEWGPRWAEVVGVVGHLRNHPGREGVEQVFLPHSQSPQRTMALAMRGSMNERCLVEAVRAEVRGLNPSQPVHGVRPMNDYVGETLAAPRFASVALTAFAAVALVLASVGIYGVIAFSVRKRTREIGIRMALGASPGKILESVVGGGGILIGAGIAAGLIGAFTLTRFLASQLHGVTARDPATFILVPFVLAAVALAACYLPARRAARLDPTIALREE